MIKAIIFDFNGVIYTDDYDRELLDYIKDLKLKYKIGMITNYSRRGYEKYVVPVKDYFDDIVVSSHVGLYKPDPQIYKHAAANLMAETNQCVYIDDHDFRVEGAQKAGMQGIVYEGFNQMKNELETILVAGANN